VFLSIEQIAGFVLNFIPFYNVLKLATLIWLFQPKCQGAKWVYSKYIREYAGLINEIVSKVEDSVLESINLAKSAVGLSVEV
jgi:hypothetical protein